MRGNSKVHFGKEERDRQINVLSTRLRVDYRKEEHQRGLPLWTREHQMIWRKRFATHDDFTKMAIKEEKEVPHPKESRGDVVVTFLYPEDENVPLPDGACYRKMIRAIFTEHAPNKTNVEKFLEEYKGDEKDMYRAVCNKFDIDAREYMGNFEVRL